MSNKLFVACTFSSLLALSGSIFAAGAIAVDEDPNSSPDDLGYGLGFGATTADAEKQAMYECKRYNGSHDCSVYLKFKGSCGAYAAGTSEYKYGTGSGETKEAATNAALDQCGDNCHLVVAVCENDL